MDGCLSNERPTVELSSWRQRSDHWLSACDIAVPNRRRRERQQSPLFLCGHGLSIRIDKHTLLIRDGNTHYPAKERTWRFFKGTLDIPPRIVVVDGSGEITLDALRWLAEQNVSLILLGWDGSASSVQAQTGYISDSQKVEWQRKVANSNKLTLDFATKNIVRKLQEAVITLETNFGHSKLARKSLAGITSELEQLQLRRYRNLPDLLGAEGGAAAHYFRVWNDLEISWKGLKHYPIPDDWLVYRSRSSLNDQVRPDNRNATHPVNAMLNYAYAILYRQTFIQVVAEGYDPNLGIMHQKSRRNPRHDYVLDVMEPMRPVVDRAVLELIATETFTGNDFQLQADGVCRLNPQLARRVVQVVSCKLRATQFHMRPI